MRTLLKFLLVGLLGLVIGAALVFFYLGGAPRAAQLPGAPIKPPDAGGPPPGTATIVLNEQFFNTVLTSIFRDMNAPSFPLTLVNNTRMSSESMSIRYSMVQAQSDCGKIVLKQEGSGVTTSVRFAEGKITLPLAFNGSANVFGNCVNFTGWAQANLELRFDAQNQNVSGQIKVETVNLDGVNPIVSSFVTPLVQATLNQRVNPIEILRGQQIALNLPIKSSNGTLAAKVKDVRTEVKDTELRLYITYDFAGAPTG